MRIDKVFESAKKRNQEQFIKALDNYTTNIQPTTLTISKHKKRIRYINKEWQKVLDCAPLKVNKQGKLRYNTIKSLLIILTIITIAYTPLILLASIFIKPLSPHKVFKAIQQLQTNNQIAYIQW